MRLLAHSLMAVFFCTAFLCVTPLRLAEAADPEVRATWLTTTGPDHIRSGFNTEQVMGDLRSTGLNTVYVEAWKSGYTNYPSQVLSNFTGGRDRNPAIGTTRDLLQETLIHAHRNQMNHVAWFEYGFAAQFVGSGGNPSNPLAVKMRNNGWLLRDQSGQYGNSSNGFAWMNPAVPEVRQLLIDLTLEAIDNYDLDGVQFDDRLAWPKQFGWDATTEALYLQQTGRTLPNNVNDSHFRNWRQSKVTQFATELSAAVKAARPEIQLSVSPSVTPFSDTEYNAKWPEWQNNDLFDEYVPQVYRSTLASFNGTLPGQLAPFVGAEREQLVVGLRANGTGAMTPYADLEAMIDRTRAEGVAGHSIWYSSAVRDIYGSQLTAYYDVAGEGHAANPFFGEEHRPAPAVGVDAAGSDWVFAVDQPGHYRLVGKAGSFWDEFDQVTLDAGIHTLTLSGVSQAELLLDRRPLDLADFNGDGIVDAADYSVWRASLGSTFDLRADANGDGTVTEADYHRWRADYGLTTQLAAAASVPEPSSLAFLLLALASFSMRLCPLRG